MSTMSHLVPQGTQDFFINRRRNWNGAVIRCDVPGPALGHYYRVTNSWRDPNTGYWSIDGFEHLDMKPPGERAYRYTGQTWDLPQASILASFPIFTTAAITFIYILVFALLGPTWVENGSITFMLVWLLPFYPLAIAMFWFQNYEPVKGTKFAYLVWALALAWGATQNDDSYGDDHRDYRG